MHALVCDNGRSTVFPTQSQLTLVRTGPRRIVLGNMLFLHAVVRQHIITHLQVASFAEFATTFWNSGSRRRTHTSAELVPKLTALMTRKNQVPHMFS